MNESFSVGGVMGMGFRVYARNFIPFTLISAVLYLPMLALLWWFSTFNPHHMTLGNALEILGALFAVATLIDCMVSATLTYGVVKELQGERASLVSCVSVGFSRMLPAVGVGFLAFLCIFGAGLLLFIPAIIVMCMLYVAMPASVIEKPGLMGALRRSRELTNGYKGAIFGIRFLLFVLAWVISKVETTGLETSSAGLRLGVSFGTQIVLGALGSVIAAVAYYTLRAEKEGTSATELASVFE